MGDTIRCSASQLLCIATIPRFPWFKTEDILNPDCRQKKTERERERWL